jgi:hypothetical protein
MYLKDSKGKRTALKCGDLAILGRLENTIEFISHEHGALEFQLEQGEEFGAFLNRGKQLALRYDLGIGQALIPTVLQIVSAALGLSCRRVDRTSTLDTYELVDPK